MLITLPNITYDVEEALEYYETLKRDFSDLMWTKKEMVEYAGEVGESRERDLIESFLDTMGRREPFISWPEEKLLDFINEKRWLFIDKVRAWNINVSGEEGYHPKIARQEELQFGFAKKVLDAFPTGSMLQLIVNPIGTKYHRHVDTADTFRLIFPVISDEGAVWHFDDVKNVTHLPGCAYAAITERPHATDVFGPTDRVTITLLLKPLELDWLKNYKCKI